MRKICIVSEFCIPYLYGGGEFRYYFLIKELQKLGYDVTWLCMKFRDKKGRVRRKELVDGIKVLHLGPLIEKPPFRTIFNFIHYVSALSWHLLTHKYDLIDAQAFVPLVPSLLISKLTGTKMVATIHDVSKGNKNQWLQYGSIAPLLEKLIYKLPYRKIITVSESIKRRLVQDFKIKSSKVNIVHNAIDLSLIDSVKVKSKKKNSICFVGRLATNKRVSDLIKAVAIFKNANLRIMGSGPEEDNLKKLVQDLGLEKRVIFLGRVSDEEKFSVIKNSELFVLPSVREGFGIVLIEAMACHTAVIGAKVDGVINVIEDEKDGLFFIPKDVDDLAVKIKRILTDEKFREKLVKNGRHKVESKFRWDVKAKEIVDCYFGK